MRLPQTLWDMMEKIDTQLPYGSFGIEEWIEYNLEHNKASLPLQHSPTLPVFRHTDTHTHTH